VEAVSYSLALPVLDARYEEARVRARVEPGGDAAWSPLAMFVARGVSPEVRECARLLAEKAAQARLGHLDLVSFVLAFVRGVVRYATDRETHDREQDTSFPLETLVEGRGDCEDSAILAAALLRCLGVEPALVVLVLADGTAHLGVGVPAFIDLEVAGAAWVSHEGRRYHYCEATPGGHWRFGEIPPEFAARLDHTVVIPIPRAG
jgi:hypothetical protein